MRRRTRYSLLAVGVLFALLGVALILHLHAPPRVARLLPESDAIFYLNLKPLRAAANLEKHPVKASAEYQQFIDATGIQPERDLDRVAFAMHRMDNPNGPNGPVAYTEVMEGRFDAMRLTEWLKAHSTSSEDYARHTIYSIPTEGRVFRIAILGYDTVAGSNMPTVEQIHSVIDRYEASASPFSGSSLLSARYSEVPLFSLAWGIGHVGLPFSENGKITALGVQLPLSEDTDIIASVSFRGSLHLRVEEIAPSSDVAEATSKQLSALLGIVKGLSPLTPHSQDDVTTREVLQSLKLEQSKDRVVLTGTVPPSFFERLASQPSQP